MSLLQQHRWDFESLVDRAWEQYRDGDAVAAAAYSQMAASFAWRNHPGIFHSARLENLLEQIAGTLSPRTAVLRPPERGLPVRVLHVLTQLYATGGHSRMLWRWIESDATRIHSVVLTSQGGRIVPCGLQRVLGERRGKILELDRMQNDRLARAQVLRALAAQYDAVVLHIHPSDVVPVIALAGVRRHRPVIFVNHADHVFWIGTNLAGVIASIRGSGARLAGARRHIAKDTEAILPIPRPCPYQALASAAAKRALGLPSDATVMLSVASGYKYRPMVRTRFVDALVPLLEKYSNLYLLVVGPERDGDWEVQKGIANRVLVRGKREDTSWFYGAADIYLDSFPFSSLTSLLEAGSHGLPLITCRLHPKPAGVLGADDAALDRVMVICHGLTELGRAIESLVENPNERACLGQRTREAIADVHQGASWLRHLENVYEQALRQQNAVRFRIADDVQTDPERNELDEILASWQAASGLSCPRREVIREHLGLLPWKARIEAWTALNSEDRIPAYCLLPESWRHQLRGLRLGSGLADAAPPSRSRELNKAA